MTSAGWIELHVTEIRPETPSIRALRLARPHGEPLPGWEAGAHVKIRLPDGDERSYSLVNLSPDPAAATRPMSYLLGVRLEEPSTGGSRFMHGLAVGQSVRVSAPSNHFALEPCAGPVRLVAGGIGITPIASMAARLAASGHPFRLHYAGRSEAHLAFRTELSALAGDRLSVHCDDRSGLFDIAGLMASLAPDEPLYLCGPRPMIDAAIACAQGLGWPAGRLHVEIFAAAAPQAGDRPFEVVLAASNRTVAVPAGMSILDALVEAGLDPLYDCKRGDCGICQATVLEGVPDHRDYILSEGERAAGRLMQICVSRAKTPRLVLDL